tara:strand:+ start:466 stop:1170 length:705 start_codon:yes stop_codon:yes gene_type:complete
MNYEDYQKISLMELMNMNEFTGKVKDRDPPQSFDLKVKKIESKKINPYEANSIEELSEIYSNFIYEKSFKAPEYGISIIEGDIKSKILFLFGFCNKNDKKIIDGDEGILFDKMLNSINLNREKIALCSFIARGLEEYKNNQEFTQFNQLMIYRLIEIINPRNLVILGNYPIKMLLASNLSSMSLRGKWFDFNTPNDTSPKRTRVLYEPKMLLNNPELKKEAWQDLKELKEQIGG